MRLIPARFRLLVPVEQIMEKLNVFLRGRLGISGSATPP
jgi:hypothetical protein